MSVDEINVALIADDYSYPPDCGCTCCAIAATWIKKRGVEIDTQRRALAQIIQVCLDNEHVDGKGAKMALAFVRDVASRAGP